MRKLLSLFLFVCISFAAKGQTLAQIKYILDTTNNPIGFVKFVLKKKFYIDTVAVLSTSAFISRADSLAYHGKVGKVYGPFKKENILIKILVKAPNTFYHVKHIVLDTSTYSQQFAEKLADSIMARIISGAATFADQASIYSEDYVSSVRGGDLGWFVRGAMLPQLDEALGTHKKGDLFKVWTAAGLHIVLIPDDPKKDTGFALFLRVIL